MLSLTQGCKTQWFHLNTTLSCLISHRGSFTTCCFACVVTGTSAESAGIVLSIYHMSHIVISLSAPRSEYIDTKGRADYDQLYKIFLIFVDLLMVECPYMSCPFLIHYARLMTIWDVTHASSHFLWNILCLLNFAERNKLYCLVDQILYKIPAADKANVIQMLEAVVVAVGHSGWYAVVVASPEFAT